MALCNQVEVVDDTVKLIVPEGSRKKRKLEFSTICSCPFGSKSVPTQPFMTACRPACIHLGCPCTTKVLSPKGFKDLQLQTLIINSQNLILQILATVSLWFEPISVQIPPDSLLNFNIKGSDFGLFRYH